MNAQLMAHMAYAPAAAPTQTERNAEYAAFARVTRQLHAARLAGPEGFSRLADAIAQNRRLWSVLATDVSGDGNALPADLRARIFFLADFTREHSRRILAGKATVDALIDINTAIMRGLGGAEGAA